MDSKKIIASILITILGSVVFAGEIAVAHHPAEPCSADAAVIASGTLPACADSPDFGEHGLAAHGQDEGGRDSSSMLVASVVGATLFAVCILFFSKFSPKI